MPESTVRVLLDQNVPRAVADWLRAERPTWEVEHASEVGLSGTPDAQVLAWAADRGAAVITYDEDFADVRMAPAGLPVGVVRLHVWPTTVEATIAALRRVLDQLTEEQLAGSLTIVDRGQIRMRARVRRAEPGE